MADDLLRVDMDLCRNSCWDSLPFALQTVLDYRRIGNAKWHDKATSKAILSTIAGAGDICASLHYILIPIEH